MYKFYTFVNIYSKLSFLLAQQYCLTPPAFPANPLMRVLLKNFVKITPQHSL